MSGANSEHEVCCAMRWSQFKSSVGAVSSSSNITFGSGRTSISAIGGDNDATMKSSIGLSKVLGWERSIRRSAARLPLLPISPAVAHDYP